jgi:hypothetical protein
VLKQHSSFAKWNPSSVNIVRILTLLWDGKVRVLGGYFRLGAPGGFCDHLMYDGESPLQIPLTEDGLFMNRCYDFDKGLIYSDVRGMKIEGGILKYDEMKQKACKAHEAYPFNRLIGWDMTLDENSNIVLIEYNSRCPEVVGPQCSIGPIFDFKLDNGDNFIDTVVRLSKAKLG